MKKTKTDKNVLAAVVCIFIIAVIVALSASKIGWKVEKKAVDSVELNKLVIVLEQGQQFYQPPGIPIYTITVTNTFMPRQYEIPFVTACLYNSDKKAYSYIDAQWDLRQDASELGLGQNTIEIASGSRNATLKVMPVVRYKGTATVQAVQAEKMGPIVSSEIDVYDQLLVFLMDPNKRFNYIDCNSLQQKDIDSALKIAIK